MLREGIFLSVVNYCHMATAPFSLKMTENGGRVRMEGGRGVRKLTPLWECDLVMYLMYKGTCLTLLWMNLIYLCFFMLCSYLISVVNAWRDHSFQSHEEAK